ncbi:MAG: TspO/MBR family [Chlamydiota bacterium]|jgi:tryptophan-rich sensory protein
MTIDQSQPEPFLFPTDPWLKPSHRTWPEQAMGLALFLGAGFGIQSLSFWIASLAHSDEWFHHLYQAQWAISNWPYSPLWIVNAFCLAFPLWLIWRRTTFWSMILEVSVWSVQCLLQIGWYLCFFVFQETLVALFGLLLYWCSVLVAPFLYGRTQRHAKWWIAFPCLWVFYILALNMVICSNNP